MPSKFSDFFDCSDLLVVFILFCLLLSKDNMFFSTSLSRLTLAFCHRLSPVLLFPGVAVHMVGQRQAADRVAVKQLPQMVSFSTKRSLRKCSLNSLKF